MDCERQAAHEKTFRAALGLKNTDSFATTRHRISQTAFSPVRVGMNSRTPIAAMGRIICR
jgi:hypothetical protein